MIWFGAGLIIKSVDRIAKQLRLSSFAISFFVLGLLTSAPETAISINAVINRTPEVFVGTLLGGTVVIFLLIIPILAILGNGIKLNHDLNKNHLLGLLAVIAGPSLVVIDHRVTTFEGLLLILAYLTSFYFIHKKQGALHQQSAALSVKIYSFIDLAKVGLGIGLVYVSSQFIVSQTFMFAKALDISVYYLSLIILSLGTNLPELSLAIRSIVSGKKEIAFGDYLGSAAANTLLFGVFTIANNGEVFAFNSFFVTFLFIISGLTMFYFFAQSKKDISKKEGLVLLLAYLVFVIYEINKGFLS